VVQQQRHDHAIGARARQRQRRREPLAPLHPVGAGLAWARASTSGSPSTPITSAPSAAERDGERTGAAADIDHRGRGRQAVEDLSARRPRKVASRMVSATTGS
jgi:hypothetical protein